MDSNYAYRVISQNYSRVPQNELIHDVEDIYLNTRQRELKRQYAIAYKDNLHHKINIPQHLLWVDVNPRPVFTETDFRFFAYYKKRNDWFTELGLLQNTETASPYYRLDQNLLNNKDPRTLSEFVSAYGEFKQYRINSKPMVSADRRDPYTLPKGLDVYSRTYSLFDDLLKFDSNLDAMRNRIKMAQMQVEKYDRERQRRIAQKDPIQDDQCPPELRTYAEKIIPMCVYTEINPDNMYRWDNQLKFTSGYIQKDANQKDKTSEFDTTFKQFENILKLQLKLYQLNSNYFMQSTVTFQRISSILKDVQEVIAIAAAQRDHINMENKSNDKFASLLMNAENAHSDRLKMIGCALVNWIHKQPAQCYCGGCDGDHLPVKEEKKEEIEKKKEEVEKKKEEKKVDKKELKKKLAEQAKMKMESPNFNDLYYAYMVNPSEKKTYLALVNDQGDYFKQDGSLYNKGSEYANDYKVYQQAYNTTFNESYRYNLWVIQYQLKHKRPFVLYAGSSYAIKPKTKFPSDTNFILDLPSTQQIGFEVDLNKQREVGRKIVEKIINWDSDKEALYTEFDENIEKELEEDINALKQEIRQDPWIKDELDQIVKTKINGKEVDVIVPKGLPTQVNDKYIEFMKSSNWASQEDLDQFEAEARAKLIVEQEEVTQETTQEDMATDESQEITQEEVLKEVKDLDAGIEEAGPRMKSQKMSSSTSSSAPKQKHKRSKSIYTT